MRSFAGKVALISGASSGIGLALAHALAARGAAVAITGTSPEKLAAARAELVVAGARAMTVRFDVTDEPAWHDAAERVTAELGPIAFLGLNAGLGGGGGTIDTGDSALWNALWQANVMGVLHGLQACMPGMKASGAEGHVLITSSIAGAVRGPGLGPYGVTKAAAQALGENLSAELRDTAIGVSVLIPGPIRTGFAATTERHTGAAGDPAFRAMIDERKARSGVEPHDLAEFALDRIASGAFYIFSHSGVRGALAARGDALAEASEIALAEVEPLGLEPG